MSRMLGHLLGEVASWLSGAVSSGVASYGALGARLRLTAILFLVHFGPNLRANYPSIV